MNPAAIGAQIRQLAACLCAISVLPVASLAQTTSPQEPSPPTPPSSPPAGEAQRLEITGSKANGTDERRQSTAAKIVIGRDDIERFGDSTVGEILRRLPGVTSRGTPGRGGAPRMRGLGAGYTQILIDGQRLPPGYSLDALSPEQIERIEVLRAPTAETGARAIAGTINIVTREGFRRRLSELRVAAGAENGKLQPSVNWNHDDSAENLTYNVFASVFCTDQDTANVNTTTKEDMASGQITSATSEAVEGRERRTGVRLGSRIQWRFGEGESFVFSPYLIRSQSDTERRSTWDLLQGEDDRTYAASQSTGDGRFTLARLNGQWRQLLADGTRVEWTGNASLAKSASDTLREESPVGSGQTGRTLDEHTANRDTSYSLAGKLSKLLEGDNSLVAGFEAEASRRTEERTSLENGLPPPWFDEFGDNLRARSTRVATYAQNEWSPTPQWAAHVGLRWEAIETRGDAGDDGAAQSNRSSVWTPLLHAVWKPDAESRDQLRISLTRSYKSPTLSSLMARPTINNRSPATGPNERTHPDRAGNPDLKPELATGIDIAFERYLSAGGVLSANVFHRRIRDYIRNEIDLEDVSWSTQPRYVLRPQNVGKASTQGIELEAKFRLTELWPDAPRVDWRSNASVFRSRVDDVPAPDNRLDEQPPMTVNLGADYRPPGLPLTLGGNFNWTPAYRTRLSGDEQLETSRRRVFDAYALWVFNPAVQLRLSANNLAPLETQNQRSVEGVGDADSAEALRETSRTLSTTYVNWQLRLEMKL